MDIERIARIIDFAAFISHTATPEIEARRRRALELAREIAALPDAARAKTPPSPGGKGGAGSAEM
jgi:hypothetical protein